MVKIVELKNTITDTELIDNIYAIHSTITKIINETEFITELKQIDFNYINVILEQTRINLDKAYYLMLYEKLQKLQK